jgi:hypothetical protein
MKLNLGSSVVLNLNEDILQSDFLNLGRFEYYTTGAEIIIDGGTLQVGSLEAFVPPEK